MTEKMIPLPVIDAKIKHFEEGIKTYSGGELERVYALIIEELERIKKEAIYPETAIKINELRKLLE